jgi:hypothetical protein
VPKTIELSGYSDDCASITGVEDSEYDVPGRWYDLKLDGTSVAKVRIYFKDSNWIVEMKSDQHDLSVEKRKR